MRPSAGLLSGLQPLEIPVGWCSSSTCESFSHASLRVQEHLQEVKRREEAQQAVLAAKREEADRIYTRLKAEKEAAQAAQDEQDSLVNLLQQEEVEARQRQKEQDMRNYRVRTLLRYLHLCFSCASLEGVWCMRALGGDNAVVVVTAVFENCSAAGQHWWVHMLVLCHIIFLDRLHSFLVLSQGSSCVLLNISPCVMGCTDPVSSELSVQARIKKEMIAANKKQMELKAAAQAAAAAEEDRLKQSMLAKFAEDDRLEQMNAQKRRMRALEHRKEVYCPYRPFCTVIYYVMTSTCLSEFVCKGCYSLCRSQRCLLPRSTVGSPHPALQ